MITPFTKVLVGTDFSEPAARAGERAIDVARRYEAAIHIVHVFTMPLLDGAPHVPIKEDWVTPIVQAAREQLNELVEGLRRGRVDVASMLRSGAASEQILALIGEVHADLLVLGTHGRTGLRHVLLGSIAERLVRHSPVPILTVH